jgi:DNA-binding NarL/FixJ family response regulator
MFGDEDNVLASIEAGALGYIHKDSTPDDIAQRHPGDEIRRVAHLAHDRAAGAVQVPEPARRRGAAAASPPVAPASCLGRSSAPRPVLSTREHEVLELIARGFSYAEIARLQSVSVHTVQTHIKNLYRKLAVRSRGEAVFEATQLGLLARPA